MGKYTKEEKEIINKSLDNLTFRQTVILAWWDIFCHKRRNEYVKWIMFGMHPSYAWCKAKNM